MMRWVWYACATILAVLGVLREDVYAAAAAVTLAVLTVAEELRLTRDGQRRSARAFAAQATARAILGIADV